MNSRQYEAMRLKEEEQREAKKSERAQAKKLATQNKFLRHLKRKGEDGLADDYFNHQFKSLKEVKAIVKNAGWTWAEAQRCKHRHLGSFLDPVINVWLNTTQRTKYKRMFKKEVAFLFVHGPLERVIWYPTLDDIVDFLEEGAIVLKDPDHVGLTDIHFTKDNFVEDSGKVIDFYYVEFNLDS